MPLDTTQTQPGLTVTDVKGVPSSRRQSVAEAVIAAGSSLADAHEAWVVPARKPPAFSVRIVGPRGFYREVQFSGAETAADIEHRIRTAVQR